MGADWGVAAARKWWKHAEDQFSLCSRMHAFKQLEDAAGDGGIECDCSRLHKYVMTQLQIVCVHMSVYGESTLSGSKLRHSKSCLPRVWSTRKALPSQTGCTQQSPSGPAARCQPAPTSSQQLNLFARVLEDSLNPGYFAAQVTRNR